MSHVDNWLLLPDLMDGDEDGPVYVVNARLADLDKARQQSFRLLDAESWGGAKFPERRAFGMAANHLPESLVIEAVNSAPWSEPQNGLLLVCRQHDDAWQILKLDKLAIFTTANTTATGTLFNNGGRWRRLMCLLRKFVRRFAKLVNIID